MIISAGNKNSIASIHTKKRLCKTVWGINTQALRKDALSSEKSKKGQGSEFQRFLIMFHASQVVMMDIPYKAV
ncbi:hypothetical protein CEXT_363021 [Caerostris extrusa]|uniref:Uncharacterized protein n=1 Tax=Caerostris extrusa TaxID=172846 RepID=A0AAV4NE73_CAEEX|nr:hypothetical protein CEXT_363021 [Caerostris extrusa]